MPNRRRMIIAFPIVTRRPVRPNEGCAWGVQLSAALTSDERRLRSAVLPPFAIRVVQEQQRCRQLPSRERRSVPRLRFAVDQLRGRHIRRNKAALFAVSSRLHLNARTKQSQRQTIDRAVHGDGVTANLA